MTDVIEKLNDNLKKQASIYKELYSIEERKQKALLDNNLKEIEATTLLEEHLILEAGKLDQERLLWSGQIGNELGQDPEDLTLAELAERFPVLEDVRGELEQILRSLKEMHEVNTQLLKQAMKIVEFTIGLLTHQDRNTTYKHPNQKEKDVSDSIRHLLDRRV